MTPETPDLGQPLARTQSIPESIQHGICIASLVAFVVLWQLQAASVFVLLGGALFGAVALLAVAHCIPALRSSLAVCPGGLELVIHGKPASFAFEQLTCLAAKFTHHELNRHYIGTRAKIEFTVEGRQRTIPYDGEFRRGGSRERVLALAIEACSQAIQRRLLAELDRAGAVRWRDHVLLTDEGIVLVDSADASRLIPYGQIGEWKIVDNNLKIWKTSDALPCLVLGNETPNFVPLLSLFETLCAQSRKVGGGQPRELVNA